MGSVVHEALDAGLAGAVGAAVDLAIPLDTVAEDAAFAVIANRGEDVDGALEGVEAVGLAREDDIKTFVVGVSAVMAGFHGGGEGWIGGRDGTDGDGEPAGEEAPFFPPSSVCCTGCAESAPRRAGRALWQMAMRDGEECDFLQDRRSWCGGGIREEGHG